MRFYFHFPGWETYFVKMRKFLENLQYLIRSILCNFFKVKVPCIFIFTYFIVRKQHMLCPGYKMLRDEFFITFSWKCRSPDSVQLSLLKLLSWWHRFLCHFWKCIVSEKVLFPLLHMPSKRCIKYQLWFIM